MKRTRIFSLLVMLCISVCVSTSSAFAQITVDTRDTELVTIQTGSGFIVPLKANNSYCCSVYPQGANTNAGLSATIEELGGPATVTGVLRGTMEPEVSVDTESTQTDTTPADNRVCVIPTISTEYKFPIASAVNGETVKVSCDNTTLSGGFNTNGTPINFLECTNTTDAAIAGKIFATDFAGNVLINGTSFSIPPNVRQDFDVHSSVGANKYGRLLVPHNGTKKGLRCALSRYSSDLTLRASLSLE